MSFIIQKGKCYARKLCMYPDMELRPEHKCPVCGELVHALCGDFNKQLDKYVCKICSLKFNQNVFASHPLVQNESCATPIPVKDLASRYQTTTRTVSHTNTILDESRLGLNVSKKNTVCFSL